MKHTIKALNIALLSLAIVLLPLITFAQAGFGPTDVTDTPIDGGISLLIAAGIGYGGRKLYQKRANNRAEKND